MCRSAAAMAVQPSCPMAHPLPMPPHLSHLGCKRSSSGRDAVQQGGATADHSTQRPKAYPKESDAGADREGRPVATPLLLVRAFPNRPIFISMQRSCARVCHGQADPLRRSQLNMVGVPWVRVGARSAARSSRLERESEGIPLQARPGVAHTPDT